jgi:dTDP-glucose 4,6-dehydratase
LRTVLVTGAAGFIGAHLAEHLLGDANTRVLALDDLSSASAVEKLSGLDKKRVEFIEGSITDSSLVDYLVKDSDTVVNLAAWSHNDTSIVNPEPFIQANIIGTFNLLQSAVKHNKRFHQVSTDEVFGDTEVGSEELFSELSPYRPSSPYSSSKAAADQLVMAWTRTYQLDATISYSANNYGEYQHPEKFIPRQITRLLDGKPIEIYGTGDNVRNWIDVKDHARGIAHILANRGVSNSYCISGPSSVSNLNLANNLLRVMDLDQESLKFVADRPGHDRRYGMDSRRISQELGFEASDVGVSTALASLVRWYQSNRAWWAPLVALEDR